ncbi:MAG: FkbM family methyltransferase [Pseudomonadota bacterium]
MPLASALRRRLREFLGRLEPCGYLAKESGAVTALRWLYLDSFRPKTEIDVTIRGARLTIRAGTPDLTVAFASLCGEFDELAGLVREGEGVVIDAGGYIGTAAIALSRLFPDREIVTVEPTSANFALLERNVAAFSNITPVKAAIGPAPGTLKLYDAGNAEWGFSQHGGIGGKEGRLVEEVEIATIPDLLARTGASDIALLKLDIEGSERELLAARPDWVERCQVIAAELHDRIAPGATRSYIDATAEGRRDVAVNGEKLVSVRL